MGDNENPPVVKELLNLLRRYQLGLLFSGRVMEIDPSDIVKESIKDKEIKIRKDEDRDKVKDALFHMIRQHNKVKTKYDESVKENQELQKVVEEIRDILEDKDKENKLLTDKVEQSKVTLLAVVHKCNSLQMLYKSKVKENAELAAQCYATKNLLLATQDRLRNIEVAVRFQQQCPQPSFGVQTLLDMFPPQRVQGQGIIGPGPYPRGVMRPPEFPDLPLPSQDTFNMSVTSSSSRRNSETSDPPPSFSAPPPSLSAPPPSLSAPPPSFRAPPPSMIPTSVSIAAKKMSLNNKNKK